MANLFKQKTTRNLPKGAEIDTRKGERFAKWTDGKGRKRTARVVGEGDAARIVTESGTWYARIRMADGTRVDVSTGCRDKSAAMSRLTELMAEQEKIRAGVITQREANTAKHGRRDYAETVAAFIAGMKARGCAKGTCSDWTRFLKVGNGQLGWRTLSDMDRAALENWLSLQAATLKDEKDPLSSMGARVHNTHVTAFTAFGTWCVRQGYVKTNPFKDTMKRDERADRRRQRRALTEQELSALIETARTRPLTEALKGNRGRGKHMDKEGATLSKDTVRKLEFLGWTRALAYWTAAATGLRWGELRSITLGAVRLDSDPPHLILAAKDEKARRGAQIPLQRDLAAELETYLPERRLRLVGHPGASVTAFPGSLDGVPMFDVPKNMIRVFDADCAAAGIPKRDGAGRVVDVHALRHTFGTLLARAGVPLQLAQRAMRHSSPTLTANVYTHLGLVDVAGAVDRLPRITAAMEARQAANSVTPSVTPTDGKPCVPGVSSFNLTPSVPLACESGTNCVLASTGKGIREGVLKENGAGHGVRTRDIQLGKLALYQLS